GGPLPGPKIGPGMQHDNLAAGPRQGVRPPSSRSARFCKRDSSTVFETNLTDPSPRRTRTPPGCAEDRGVLQFGCTCQVAVTGGFGVCRTVVMLKHRVSAVLGAAA